MAKASSAEDYKLSSSFEEVRKKLLIEDFSGRLSKPLAYWALPNDRRLPLAFLGRTVGDLLNTPFGELTEHAGKYPWCVILEVKAYRCLVGACRSVVSLG